MPSTSRNSNIMVDDISESSYKPLEEAAITKTLAEIARLKFHRILGYNWAEHQLRVLVSDEYEDEGNEEDDASLPYNPYDIQDMERYAIELSLQETTSQEDDPLPDPPTPGSLEEEVANCPRCGSYPRFSKTKRTRRFRLVNPWKYFPGVEKHMCNHFLAVSYCWASQQNSARTCRIQDCTTSTSPQPEPGMDSGEDRGSVFLSSASGRVPGDDVIDRAVQFAAHEGLRCIWIDQACLPQDNSLEHQIGIQSMDMVYQRAARTVGLLETGCITSQQALVSLAFVFARVSYMKEWNERPGQEWWNLHFSEHNIGEPAWGMFDEHVPKEAQAHIAKVISRSILDLLHSLFNDQWFTRAWILQESMSAGTCLSLLLPVAPGLQYLPSPFSERRGKLLRLDADSEQSFMLTSLEFFDLVRGTNHLIEEVFDGQQIDSGRWRVLGPDETLKTDDSFLLSVRKFLDKEKLQRLYPFHHMHCHSGCGCQTQYVCNAASAVTLLRDRDCLHIEDKVAIIGNICNFDIRLDTFRLAKKFKSLKLCIIALAIMNGDLSLLGPEHYKLEATGKMPNCSLIGFSYKNLNYIDKVTLEIDSSPRFQTINTQFLHPGGLVLPATLWSVNREVHFGPIGQKWASRWQTVRALIEKFDGLPGETQEDAKKRMAAITHQLHRESRAEMHRIRGVIQFQEENGYEFGHVYQEHKYPGVRFSLGVVFAQLNFNEEVMGWFGEIVKDVLIYLYNNKEYALADSIWQSLRRGVDAETGILPDKVSPELFALRLFQNEPWRLLNPKVDRERCLMQEWLFNRIILRRKLWVGSYVPTNTCGSASSVVQPLSVISNDIFGDKRHYQHTLPPNSGGHDEVDCTLNIVRESLGHQNPVARRLIEPLATKPSSRCLSNIVGRDGVKQILTHHFTQQWRSPERVEMELQKQGFGMLGAALGYSSVCEAMMHYIPTYVGWDLESHDKVCSDRVSAFDVDSPCLIATPFDASRERLPSAEERGMASCWVVRRQGCHIEDEEKDWLREEFVRLRRLLLGASPDESLDDITALELENVSVDVVEDMRALRLKVEGFVKGTWEILDPMPFQAYLFS
ncbi:hypothetical protein F4802DRAFT_279348 [Xylaria palmicola]|nr:hypothetical protein F4802DRAFT_279348 [Xylaria palmicola]